MIPELCWVERREGGALREGGLRLVRDLSRFREGEARREARE